MIAAHLTLCRHVRQFDDIYTQLFCLQFVVVYTLHCSILRRESSLRATKGKKGVHWLLEKVVAFKTKPQKSWQSVAT